ncbi:hypothetical protein TTHERM_00554530 (macronuclear) [Tetrahymena thermophila SB210]|uniref:Uncharacterized protein n=1 Tax=Tetrahymena thermophila (strain SB210) TaxID=312017 RepID=Q22UH2_TETTS|nr:hypothetical protein TTHERM_00554530 [Tetrahymena thermophila SB210]EAR88998.1 hypothetical protein TTHERM_00554530 [Tetrahymena thermophila SB210]|eukprot:XP_001009243.1 hypothetical protein TTHERM_00554530 [Tetrahymena thermophila SB210]
MTALYVVTVSCLDIDLIKETDISRMKLMKQLIIIELMHVQNYLELSLTLIQNKNNQAIDIIKCTLHTKSIYAWDKLQKQITTVWKNTNIPPFKSKSNFFLNNFSPTFTSQKFFLDQTNSKKKVISKINKINANPNSFISNQQITKIKTLKSICKKQIKSNTRKRITLNYQNLSIDQMNSRLDDPILEKNIDEKLRKKQDEQNYQQLEETSKNLIEQQVEKSKHQIN